MAMRARGGFTSRSLQEATDTSQNIFKQTHTTAASWKGALLHKQIHNACRRFCGLTAKRDLKRQVRRAYPTTQLQIQIWFQATTWQSFPKGSRYSDIMELGRKHQIWILSPDAIHNGAMTRRSGFCGSENWNMIIIQPQNLANEKNRHKSSYVHIPTFWSLITEEGQQEHHILSERRRLLICGP